MSKKYENQSCISCPKNYKYKTASEKSTSRPRNHGWDKDMAASRILLQEIRWN